MASLNRVTLIGNLGADPETRVSPGGEAICNLRIATTETWKDKATGERKEASEWHRVGFYGKLAEVVGQYLKKGSQVYIEGSLRTRKWQDKTGQDRYTTEIRGDVMKMIGGKTEGQQQSAAPRQQAPQRQQTAPPAGDFDDDIPFMRHAHGAAWRVI